MNSATITYAHLPNGQCLIFPETNGLAYKWSQTTTLRIIQVKCGVDSIARHSLRTSTPSSTGLLSARSICPPKDLLRLFASTYISRGLGRGQSTVILTLLELEGLAHPDRGLPWQPTTSYVLPRLLDHDRDIEHVSRDTMCSTMSKAMISRRTYHSNLWTARVKGILCRLNNQEFSIEHRLAVGMLAQSIKSGMHARRIVLQSLYVAFVLC
jgi:hypothetical protein